jgi:outer membrane protein OmpA-like peptidoglycan-associated protein
MKRQKMNSAKKSLIVALMGAVALTACTPTDTYTGDPNTRTKEGALAGAATGALVGILTGDDKDERRRNAVIGGILGAGAGAAIGSNLDKQAAELQGSLDGRIGIIRSGNQLIVRMPQDITFATDSASVSSGLQDDLRSLAASMNRYPNTRITVIGHTDNAGASAYNQDLSNRRAGSVAGILIGAGVSSGRISAYGVGETQPIASNDTASGKAQNRRVDIVITEN